MPNQKLIRIICIIISITKIHLFISIYAILIPLYTDAHTRTSVYIIYKLKINNKNAYERKYNIT